MKNNKKYNKKYGKKIKIKLNKYIYYIVIFVNVNMHKIV